MTPVFVITLSDVIGLSLLTLCLLAIVIVLSITWFKQAMCKHDGGINETMACDAICRKCGKNLGFIGTWRDQHRDKE